MNNKQIQDYILNLDDDASIDELRLLIGKSFSIMEYGYEWGNPVLDYDRLEITEIKASIDISTGKLSCVLIYSNYMLDGYIKFNANSGLLSIKNSITTERGNL